MKSLFIALLIVVLSGINSLAQDTISVDPSEVPLAILRRMEHEIGINDQQKATALTILIERSKQLDLLKAKDKTIKLSKASCKVPNEQAMTKLLAILSVEQRVKLMAIRQNDQAQKRLFREEEFYKTTEDLELDF